MNIIDKAYNLIEEYQFEEAKKLAKLIIDDGEVEGYFILTDIEHEKENLEKCIQILKKGITEFGNHWKLWMRLGNYQSDTQQYEEAQYSFERAQYATDSDVSLVKLNKAVLAFRQKQLDTALNLLEDAWDDYSLRCYCLKLEILDSQQKYNEILNSINQELFDEDNDDEETASQILFYLSKASYKFDKKEDGIKYLKASLKQNRNNENSLWLRREIYGKINSKNKYFRILIHGDYEDEKMKEVEMGFFTSYDVVAMTINSALKEIIEFEPLNLKKETFEVDEFEVLIEENSDPSGIYLTSGFSIYQKE